MLTELYLLSLIQKLLLKPQSSLFHINGLTVVRELQTFNNDLLKNIIVVKLSRYFEEDKTHPQ